MHSPLTLLVAALPVLAVALPAPAPFTDTLFRRQAAAYTLPPLPYAYNALEPTLSEEIMTLHHTKHHNSYVTNLNTAIAALNTANAANDVAGIIAAQSAINFNGGGHINHSLFWQNLAPNATAATGPLKEAIDKKWGSQADFVTAFNARLATLQGSGWGWLVKNADGGLEIVIKPNQDPILAPQVPVLGVDAWEHSYYLQYKNDRNAYLKAVWAVINWNEAGKRFGGSTRLVSFGKWRMMRV